MSRLAWVDVFAAEAMTGNPLARPMASAVCSVASAAPAQGTDQQVMWT